MSVLDPTPPERAGFHDAHGGECTVDATIALVNCRPA
jgi:hypothetical protein